MNLKNESELGYIQISFTDQEAFTDNTWKLHVNCASLHVLEVRSISHGTLLPQNMKKLA